MRFALDQSTRLAFLAAGLWLVGSGSSAFADEPATPAEVKIEPEKTDEAPSVSLYDAVRQGDVAVKAEGRGDGRMTVSLTNKSKRPLKVILPPGLIASGATGQFGGMGGMGGGMGGMGGMMSVPPTDPSRPGADPNAFSQKKSS